MNRTQDQFDVIVVGAGMGGLTAASLLANDGYSVLVLEAAHVPGGCSSSYKRKGYIFESGATTLIGFDDNQPLKILENRLGLRLPKKPIDPSMTVYQDDKKITRWYDREKWITESKEHFGEETEQEEFWKLAFKISDIIWKVSGKNNFFPPLNFAEGIQLLKNDIRDLWVLPYAIKSVKETALNVGISNPQFYRFLDEQLMISAQSTSSDTPFLFGAPAITYTNYTNFYVPGGLIKMVEALQEYIEEKGSEIHTMEKVQSIEKSGTDFIVRTSKSKLYRAKSVISNLPVWNMPEITTGKMAEYFRDESAKYQNAWGAFTLGVVTDDPYPEEMSLHHQIHVDKEEPIRGLESGSIFVSLSEREDLERAPSGERVLNVSAHTTPSYWFNLNGDYDARKKHVQDRVVDILKEKLPGFSKADVKLVFSASPVTWQKWVHRKKGRVGGIPQSMLRSLTDWTPAQTPFDGLFLCGDTVFPGQGIPGVTLSGINVYLRIIKTFNNRKFFELPG
ncbi:MAG: NAD(P)/FAD-dependent oxidoreductase [Balneolaceae bacterium]|nr:NAD(P)/FAD-dependent oxidoreductase [Balneolaceae bacterium]